MRSAVQKTSVLQELQEHPELFTLNQALRLLGMPHTATYAQWLQFLEQKIHVRPWLSLAFPATELTALDLDAGESRRIRITETSFGLYSTLGPLPTFYTEELLEEARRDESVSRDFLDVINSHLYKNAIRASLHNKLFRRAGELGDPQARHIFYCLMGEAYPSLRAEGPPQMAVLQLLLRRSRSAMGLEDYLSYALHLPKVTVEQCVARTVRIPERQRCRLGMDNAQLGGNAVLGQQVEDRTGKFRIHIHEVDEQTRTSFLYARDNQELYRDIRLHVQRFLDVPLEFDLVLHPEPEKSTGQQLGKSACIGRYLAAPGTVCTQPVTVYHSDAVH